MSKKLGAFFATVALCLGVRTRAADAQIYKYEDSEGTIHFVDGPEKIPAKYRKVKSTVGGDDASQAHDLVEEWINLNARPARGEGNPAPRNAAPGQAKATGVAAEPPDDVAILHALLLEHGARVRYEPLHKHTTKEVIEAVARWGDAKGMLDVPAAARPRPVSSATPGSPAADQMPWDPEPPPPIQKPREYDYWTFPAGDPRNTDGTTTTFDGGAVAVTIELADGSQPFDFTQMLIKTIAETKMTTGGSNNMTSEERYWNGRGVTTKYNYEDTQKTHKTRSSTWKLIGTPHREFGTDRLPATVLANAAAQTRSDARGESRGAAAPAPRPPASK